MHGESTRRLGSQDAHSIKRICVTVLDGPDNGKTFEADAAEWVSVGGAPDNQLVLRDPAVSRYHLELRQAPRGIHVRDLGSLNGTQVGGLWLQEATIPSGTVVKVGSTALRVEDAASRQATVEHDGIDIPSIIGRSPAMRELRRTIMQLSRAQTSVLIGGETGTGKELVARAIHEQSDRAGRPFVVVDCGSLPATLIASELFGHEKGAFTSAERRHLGAFERAEAGTIFLDEVGELPPQVQSALLGVLERREFRRLGGEKQLRVEARVLAATNRDLRAEVNQSTFRADLYYRLATTKVMLAPLRERPEDIPYLVEHFAEQLTGASSLGVFSEEALAQLKQQSWGGNIRELRNVVEAALAMGQLQLDGQSVRKDHALPTADAIKPYRMARADALLAFETEYLNGLMAACQQNASEAARKAHMDRPYLLSLLKRHGLR